MNERWRRILLQNAVDSALSGDMKPIQKLLNMELEFNLDWRLEDKLTPLEQASEDGDTNLVKFLIEAGANPKIGQPLLIAAFRGWVEIYDILFPLVSKEEQIEASQELPKGLLRRAKADSQLDYDWDD